MTALDELVAIFQRWLFLPDPGTLYVVLATIAANLRDGDPVWLLIVAAPSSGKSEIIAAITGLPYCYPAATITEPALLSGAMDKHSSAKGGLLREIGDFGILVLKDFGSILSMHRDARASVLAALREIYDGAWTRHIGARGGETLAWEGKIGLIAGCTETWDEHYAVIGSMGDRFILYRFDPVDGITQAARGLDHRGTERLMRRELDEAVADLLGQVDTSGPPFELDETDKANLTRLTDFVVRCRATVIRDGRDREIETFHAAEGPARLTNALATLWIGLHDIGVDHGTGWSIIVKVAMDSMPPIRRNVLRELVGYEGPVTITDIATTLGLPTTTTRRALEDLAAHKIVWRQSGGQGKPDTWLTTPLVAERWPYPEEIATGREAFTEPQEDLL